MPQSTDPQSKGLSKSVSSLIRLFPPSFLSRRKVFYDSPGLLDQSQHWGGLVIWTIAAGTTASLLWAFTGRVDQTVTASGTLQPLGGKMIVSSPAGGIVREVFVADGEIVAKGEELIVVESKGTTARLQAAPAACFFSMKTSFQFTFGSGWSV